MMEIGESDPLEGSSYDLGVTVKAEVKQEDEDDHFSAIRKVNRVSWRQVEVLCDFLNSNRDVATAHNRSLQDKEYSQRKWIEVASILNSQYDGAHKDWRGWSKYWVDYKAKLKIKVAALRGSNVRAGGGPSTEKPLTQIDEKFLQIFRHDLDKSPASVREESSNLRSFWVDPYKDPLESCGVIMNMDAQDSSESNPHVSPNSNQSAEPVQQTNPQNMNTESKIQDSPASSPNTTLPQSPRPASAAGTPPPRRRRGRRAPHSSLAAARRDLVRSSRTRAAAAVRTSEAMQQMVRHMAALQDTAKEIVSVLKAAFPGAGSNTAS